MQPKSIITYSALRMFQNCRRKYFLRYVECLTPIKRDEVLYLGSVWHEVLELWYKPGERDAKLSAIHDLIDKSFPGRISDPSRKRDWHLCHVMFDGYRVRYPEEDFQILTVEQEFSIPIINPLTGRSSRTFELRGKVDGLVQMRGSGELFLLEHKSAAQITGDYIERLPSDFQINLYSMALSRFLKRKISGVIYNVTRKASLKQSEGETEAQFEVRRAELIERSKTGKSSANRKMPESDEAFRERLREKYSDPEMFYREILYLSDEDALRTSTEIWDITKLILTARRENSWIPNWESCFKFGSQPCRYWPLCRSSNNPNVRENFYKIAPPNEELVEPEPEPIF